MKPFARIILVLSLALAAVVVAGCVSARFANDPNVVFAVEGGWDGDFTFRQLQNVDVNECVIDSGVKSPSGKYSVVVECPSPDVSAALNVDIIFAVRPNVAGNSVMAQLLYFSAPSFLEDYYDHRYVDEKSIGVTHDGILSYTMWCSSQDGKRDRTYNVSVPLAFTWGKRIEGKDG